MKTSNKLLIAIVALTMVALVSFDLALRAEYLKGDYKSPHYNMTSLSLKDFDAIEDYTTSETFLAVNQGHPFEAWISKEAEKDLVFTVENRVLKINFKTTDSRQPRSHNIEIRCPELKSLTTDLKNNPKTMYAYGNVTITIIKQDSLQIKANALGSVFVTAVALKKLNVLMKQGDMALGGGSTIDTANFNIYDNGKLDIKDAAIGKIKYKISDNAAVTLSGRSLQQLPK